MSTFSEPPSFPETLAQRKDSAARTLHSASPEELHTLVAGLYSDETQPFAEAFMTFIDEHRSEPAFQGETSDGIGFVYYPRSNRGMWYKCAGDTAEAVGLLGETSLKVLSELYIVGGHF